MTSIFTGILNIVFRMISKFSSWSEYRQATNFDSQFLMSSILSFFVELSILQNNCIIYLNLVQSFNINKFFIASESFKTKRGNLKRRYRLLTRLPRSTAPRNNQYGQV